MVQGEGLGTRLQCHAIDSGVSPTALCVLAQHNCARARFGTFRALGYY